MQQIIDKFSQKRILVLGDVMIDRYVYGDVTKLSPEAPVPVLGYTRSVDIPGGAANVAANLLALGANASLIGVTGQDNERDNLCNILNGLDTSTLIQDSSRYTIVKQRFVDNEKMQQLLRMDRESTTDIVYSVEQRVVECLQDTIPSVDAIVISDYAKGLFTEQVSKSVRALAQEYNKPIVADVKPKHLSLIHGVYVVKPNLKEAREMSSKQSVNEIAKDISYKCDTNVVLTIGKDGMLVYEKSGTSRRIAAHAKQIFDVTGAGDTVNAVLALSIASGASLYNAARIANAAAGVVVQKLGTSTLTSKELLDILELGG